MYGLTVNELAAANQLPVSSVLQIGQRLRIPAKPKPTIDVLLYVEPRDPLRQSMIDEVRDRAGSLTYLAMFSYQAMRDGSLKRRPMDDIPNIASSAGAANALVVSNLENYAFDADLAHAIFSNVVCKNHCLEILFRLL